MPSIPEGITREHIIDAIRALDAGVEHPFGESTGYDVLFEGRRYPPKAVVGVAARHIANTQLRPRDFTGGLGSKCFRVLEVNQFQIITKGDNNPFPEEVDETEPHIEGSVTQVIVNRYERDPRARAKCIEEYGPVCMVCGLDFAIKYGVVGEGFIHVHHNIQLADMGEEYEVDPILT